MKAEFYQGITNALVTSHRRDSDEFQKLLNRQLVPDQVDVRNRLVRRANYYLSRMEAATGSTVSIFGTHIQTCRGVFNPGVSKSSAQFAKWVTQAASGCRVLDIGTGTGVLGIVAATHAASYVLMTDRSSLAVACAEKNSVHNLLSCKVDIIQSLSAASINERFDLVLFAAPYLWFEPPLWLKDKYGELAYSMFDTDDSAKRDVIDASGRLLSPGGLLALQVGSMSRLDCIWRWAQSANLRLVNVENQPDGRERNILMIYEARR